MIYIGNIVRRIIKSWTAYDDYLSFGYNEFGRCVYSRWNGVKDILDYEIYYFISGGADIYYNYLIPKYSIENRTIAYFYIK